MEKLDKLKSAWQEMATTDPMWFILSDAEKRVTGWDEEAFFRLGEADADALIDQLTRLGHVTRGRVLDFGCGIGRVALGFRRHFREVIGVDISAEMIHRACNYALDADGIEFLVNEDPNLSIFGNDEFDVVYSNGVLQHLPSHELQIMYLGEFLRICKPDGLIYFQLPHRSRRLSRALARRRPYKFLRTIGFSAETLHRRLHLHAMEMTPMREAHVVREIQRLGGVIAEVQRPTANNRFYICKPRR